MKVTLKQLAKKVNCDISTVSRVVNNKPNRVSKETRDKILNAARKMEYIPNLNASNLANGKTRTIGVMVLNISDPVYAEYIENIDRYLSSKNYSIIPFITYDDPAKERQCLTALQSRQVDAMISLDYNPVNDQFYKTLQKKGNVLTFRADVEESNIDFDTALVDLSSGYYHLGKHLMERECYNIGVVGGYIANEIAADKQSRYLNNFKKVHHEAGIEVSRKQGIPCEDSHEGAYAAVLETLRQNPKKFDALIVQNTHKVLGVHKALCDLNLRVPEDIKLCTISDLDLCRMLPTPVTVWAQPIDDICRSLVELTLERLEKPMSAVRKVSFDSKLIVRKSTGG
jgi:LacI family transcriptional regulator, galactose operon repressor